MIDQEMAHIDIGLKVLTKFNSGFSVRSMEIPGGTLIGMFYEMKVLAEIRVPFGIGKFTKDVTDSIAEQLFHQWTAMMLAR